MSSQIASIQKSLTLHQTAKEETASATGNSPVVRRKRFIRRTVIGDFIVVAGALLLLGRLASPADPFWLSVNPTPFLLIPILLGGRYGPATGLGSGLLAVIGIVWYHAHLGTPVAKFFGSHAFTLACFPILGLICGEIHAFFKSKSLALARRCEELEEKCGQSGANLELFADSNLMLQKRLAVHGVRMNSLDSELRRLLGPGVEDFYAESLALLNRVTDVSEAAIYSVDGIKLKRQALFGNGDDLPEEIRADKVEIIDQAIVEKQMVTCRELWGDTPQLFSNYLAAIPWFDPHSNLIAMLVIRRLPFHCATWHHFAQIETICEWISQFAHLRSDSNSPKTGESYERLVELCVDTHRKHALPSAAAYFVAKENNTLTQKQLQEAISPLLRDTDLATRLSESGANLAVLMPMEGRREAEQLAAQVAADLAEQVDSHLTQTEDLDSAERFLGRLTGHE